MIISFSWVLNQLLLQVVPKDSQTDNLRTFDNGVGNIKCSRGQGERELVLSRHAEFFVFWRMLVVKDHYRPMYTPIATNHL